MMFPHIHDGPAIGHHVTLETPVTAQQVAEQEPAGTGRFTIDAVVRSHHRIYLALLYQGLERWQVGVVQVALAGAGIEVMTVGLGPAMHGKVLGGGIQLAVDRVVPLQTAHEGDAHAAGKVGVFAVSLLATPPARVAEDVDVGRPVGQSLIAGMRAFAQKLMMFGTRFVTDGARNLLHQRDIKGGRQADGLREDSGLPCPCNAVQAFVPPIIGRYSQALDRGCGVLHLRSLFLQRHPRHQRGGPALEAAACIQPRAVFGAA